MATKLITLVPSLSTEEIQTMIDVKTNELDFENHLTANNPHNITPSMIGAASINHTHVQLPLEVAINPTFTPGWASAFTTGNYSFVCYAIGQFVYFQGAIKRSGGASSIACRMPSAYRPNRERKFPILRLDNDTIAYVIISTNGNLTISSVVSGATYNLDGIFYRFNY